jgi:hypothetical protein
MQLLASDSHFSTASIIFSSCGFPKQLPPKRTKAIFAANVCGPVEGQRGGTSKRVSSSRRASSILVHLPAVSEPFITWTMSGEAEFQEREGNRPWIIHRICFARRTSTPRFTYAAVFCDLPIRSRIWKHVLQCRDRGARRN